MFPLVCSVRRCGQPLQQQDSRLACSNGHSFDRARQGYWPLIQPQDRQSLKAGDHEDAVDARARWLARGTMQGLVQHLEDWTRESQVGDETKTLELGSGEGTLARELFQHLPGLYCGIELSKRAIKLAARKWPQATWVLANADRTLPIGDNSIHRCLSMFGRRPVPEVKRVLHPEGSALIVVPGPSDLIELREAVQKQGTQRDRTKPIVDEFLKAQLVLQHQSCWRASVLLDEETIRDALAMTYRGARHSQHPALESLKEQSVTLEAEVMVFTKSV